MGIIITQKCETGLTSPGFSLALLNRPLPLRMPNSVISGVLPAREHYVILGSMTGTCTLDCTGLLIYLNLYF